MSEKQYLKLIEKIINNGSDRPDRTGVGTLSLFGEQMKFSLRDSFPLITTRKIFFRGVVEELLWFIRGSTNSKELSSKGVNIWNANGSKTFLENLGFMDREEGDLGPIYGFQWRHFGAEYIDMHRDYSKCGIDQLQNVINTIKKDPYNRRIILTAWNPIDIPKMVLPPCHCFVQFYVANGELSCQLYQRSADMGLGVPFNIASYSLLTYMIAKLTQLKPGDFIHTIGDCHVYKNHVDQLNIQLSREPLPFPSLKIRERPFYTIDDFSFEDFNLENYNFHRPLKLNIAV